MKQLALGSVSAIGLALLVFAAACMVGCVHTSVKLPNNGGEFDRWSFLSNAGVGKVDVRISPTAGVTIDGYNNQQTDVAAAALQLAGAALKK